MPKLVRFVVTHMLSGFIIGTLTGLTIVGLFPHSLGHGDLIDPLALALQIYAFGASFALGSLGTALMGRID